MSSSVRSVTTCLFVIFLIRPAGTSTSFPPSRRRSTMPWKMSSSLSPSTDSTPRISEPSAETPVARDGIAIQATGVSSSNMVTTILSGMNALLTDLYELNMVASYLRRGMEGAATFSLFVRRLPGTRGFIVASGLESCLDFLEQLRFEDDDTRYLH